MENGLTKKRAVKEVPPESEFDDDPFLSLADCVYLAQTSPAELASTIERGGIFGWDRFGRYKHFELGSPEACIALDALATVHARYLQRKQFDSTDAADLPLDDYGWRVAEWPAFPGGSAVPPDEQAVRAEKAKDIACLLAIIGALMRFIRGELYEEKHPAYESDNKLRELILDALPLVPGLRKRNLQDVFALGKKVLADAN